MSMAPGVVVRPMADDELQAVSAMAMAVFSVHVAADFSAEGIEVFSASAEPDQIEARNAADHFTLVAHIDSRLAGMIQMRTSGHVRMLFVLPDVHRRGIGRALVTAATERLEPAPAGPTRITVSSSRYAVSAYQRMGFEVTGETDTTSGVISVPMQRERAPTGVT